MTRWREATNATNPYQPVGERRSCQMTELDSDRAQAQALNIYLAALVVDGRGDAWYLLCGVVQRVQ